jgi:hypothetical protein
MNIVTKFLASTFSGYLSIMLAVAGSIALYYVIDTQLEIRILKNDLEDCKTNEIVAIEKVKSEREQYNFDIQKEILESNIKSEIEKNNQLKNVIKELEVKNIKVQEDDIRISKEVKILKGNCLEEKIGQNSEVLNVIFK